MISSLICGDDEQLTYAQLHISLCIHSWITKTIEKTIDCFWDYGFVLRWYEAMRSLEMMSSSGSVYSSLDIKDISKTIFLVKFTFVWIFLTSQSTGNIFKWGFVLSFSLFTFFRFNTQFMYNNVLHLDSFLMTEADC